MQEEARKQDSPSLSFSPGPTSLSIRWWRLCSPELARLQRAWCWSSPCSVITPGWPWQLGGVAAARDQGNSTLNPSGMCPQALSPTSQEPHYPSGFISDKVTLYPWLLVLSSQLVLNLDGEAIWVTFWPLRFSSLGTPGGSDGRESAAMQETRVQSLGQEDPQEKGMATHSSILAGESHEQRSMGGYSPWGCKESDTSEQQTTLTHLILILVVCIAGWKQRLMRISGCIRKKTNKKLRGQTSLIFDSKKIPHVLLQK